MNITENSDIENGVLRVIRAFLLEIDNPVAAKALNLQASIEDDLGIDSIARAEILRLLEKEFLLTIDDQLFFEAETIDDVVHAVRVAQPVKKIKGKEALQGNEKGLHLPNRASTLLQVLEHYKDLNAKKVHIFFQENGNEIQVSYGDLYERGRRVAQGLAELGVGKGDTVAIMLPTCEAFFYAFFGVLYAGAVPIPIYPPIRAKEIEEYVKKEAKILANAEVRVLITFKKGMPLSRLIKGFIPTLKKVTTVESLIQSEYKMPKVRIKTDDAVLIQYTSGSTGNPKGVLLEHRNLLANLRTIGDKIHINEKDVIVSWLPLYHDMGLIGAWLGSLYFGVPLVLQSPLAFLTRPERWLWLMHRYKGTISASPNFGYELCNHKIEGSDITGLDLSAWRLAFNGAEAIYADTIRHFVKKFESYGFSAKAIYPVYGLAESTVALSFPDLDSAVRIEKVDRELFLSEKRAVPVQEDNQGYFEFVSCGKPLVQHEIRIVDDAGNVLKEREVGCVHFRGPSAMQGYYNNRPAVSAAYHDGWWDTGDMGYLADEEFFPTGRKKDLIIKAGRNIYPADIEYVVGEIPAIRTGSVVALGVREKKSGTEKIVVVAEVREENIKAQHALIIEIRRKVKAVIGIPPDKVLLVPAKTIPKTSSGKLKRSATKTAYLNNTLRPVGVPVWMQLTKLLFKGLSKTLGHWSKLFFRGIYTVYMSIVLVVLLLPLWLLLFLLPKKFNSRLAKWVARAIVFLSACPLRVKGREYIRKGKQMVFVANHTSFADSLILLAILPVGTLFLGKEELLRVPFLRTFIKRLGHLTTTRDDFRKGEEEMRKINHTLHQGKSLVIYPEGTFTYARGIRHFKLGAFTLAAENGLPICPIASQGIRDILRGGELLLCPRSVEVTIGKPIDSTQEEWTLLSKMRDKARTVISLSSGEEKL